MRSSEPRPIRPTAWPAALLALVALAAPAWAQSGAYLRPAAFAGRVGESARVQLVNGGLTGGTAAVWPAANVDWMFIRAAGTQRNLHNPAPLAADATVVEIALEHAGATMIGADVTWPVRTASAEELERLRSRSGTAGPSSGGERAAGEVRLRHVDSSKTLIRVAAGDGAAPGATADDTDESSGLAESKSGQAAEIRPLADPLRIKLGSDLPLKVYLRGSSRGDARVTVTHADGTMQTLTANPSGIVNLRVDKAGVWMVECWHVEPAPPGSADCDWVSFRSTITFEVTGGSQ